MTDLLYGDVRYIKGIGESRAKSLAKLGITSLYGLVSYFPRAYEDRSRSVTLAETKDGEYATVTATVCTQPQSHLIRKGMELLKFDITDGTARCGVTFFNQSWVKNQLHRGDELSFYGKFQRTGNFITVSNPVFEAEEKSEMLGRIVPIYRLTAGVSQKLLVRSINQGLEAISEGLPELLPEAVRRRYGLIDVVSAYRMIHAPKSEAEIDAARTRLMFEELFILAAALEYRRSHTAELPGRVFDDADPAEFYVSLPFAPTGAQKRAVAEAFADMRSGRVMTRLVQGDVGSGKTMVAAACFWLAFASGYQSAFMAPTEILAEQHYETLSKMLAPFGVRCLLLTGRLTKKRREEARALLRAGLADVAIGTHALLSEGVDFKNLGLVVTDEQHRFGVEQRARLAEKGQDPHTLVMSATPIPRTLALILYGDLDVSIIDELPPGRQKIDTFAVKEDMRARIEAFIRRLVGEGSQVYIICPAIDENEMLNYAAVDTYCERLRSEVFPELRIGCLHGRMKAAEKEKVMRAFQTGETDVLVSTTVVEVGVDVPNAVLIVVENAERFGLSQLHQLRGRVGRGSKKSYCVLFNQSDSEESAQRLRALCKLSDGFRIAEVDLQMRGPGDFFGSAQSGLPAMKLANLASDMTILTAAQQEARSLFAEDPELRRPEHHDLRDAVSRYDELRLN